MNDPIIDQPKIAWQVFYQGKQYIIAQKVMIHAPIRTRVHYPKAGYLLHDPKTGDQVSALREDIQVICGYVDTPDGDLCANWSLPGHMFCETHG